MKRQARGLRRRDFLASMACGAAGLVAGPAFSLAAEGAALEAGEGVMDITPPLGIELAGFHRAPGNERRIKGIRQASAARGLVLRLGETQAAIVSLDIPIVPRDMVRRVQQEVDKRTGIPAQNIHVCCTHTHSMPSLRYLRQWGGVPEDYRATVEKKIVEAIGLAKADLAPAELLAGKSRAVGANSNRTTKKWKTDAEFTKDSTDDDRWLDTTVRALRFRRAGGKRHLLWYHFSAHAVCFADELAGPDWPGLIAQKVRENEKLEASALQGHLGDVNPGDGDPWRGDPDETVRGLYPALQRAMTAAVPVKVDALRVATEDFPLPLDVERFGQWLAHYRQDPAKCVGGEWVDARFAADWFQGASKWDLKQTHLPIPLSAMRIGHVGLLFHPAELFSFYGLAIQRDSPLPTTLVVGCADDAIGYLPDPNAYKAGEYAATVVPKIVDLPPFTPTAAREMTAAAVALLKKVAT